MSKTIRQTYPIEISVGILLLIFAIVFFLSPEVFHVGTYDTKAYLGMFLISTSVIIMLLILWEEILFPIHVKAVDGGMLFRNHRTKLIKQMLIYLFIPAIVLFVYFNFQIHFFPFIVWSVICIGAPIIGKLVSGINNYNDFLQLTNLTIQYKDNEKEGVFQVKEVRNIAIIRDERKILHKLEISTATEKVTIDLDKMELEDFYASIEEFLIKEYKHLITEGVSDPGT